LLRAQVKSSLAALAIRPDGQIKQIMSSTRNKNIPLSPAGKSMI